MPSARYFPPGEKATPDELQPGHFGLTHAPGLLPKLIRVGQKLRFHGAPAAFYSHAFGIVANNGDNIAMMAKGAQFCNIDQYTRYPYHIIDPGGTDTSKQQSVDFWKWCLANHTKYGYLDDISLGLRCITGGKLLFQSSGSMICSGMVAAGLNVFEWKASPSAIFPCELELRFGVLPV